MNNENKFALPKEAWEKFKAKTGYAFPLNLGFTLLTVSLFMLSAFFSEWSALVVYFLIIPLFFVFNVSLCDGHKDGDISNKRTFAYFFAYFRPPFFGTYRVIFNYLIALLLAIIAEVPLYAIFSSLYASNYSDFVPLMDEAYRLLQQADGDGLYSLFTSEATLKSFLSVMTLSSQIVLSLVFVYRLSYYLINPALRLNLGPMPLRGANTIYVGGLRSARPNLNFRKDLFLGTYWMILLFLPFFSLGIAISRLFFANLIDEGGSVMMGFAFGALVISPFFPYLIFYLDLLATRYRNSFLNYSIQMAEEALNSMKLRQEVNEEEQKALEDAIKEFKTSQEKENEKDDDSSDQEEK